ncbi:hypothetical protein QBC43DRAFT_316663 [Cladorrhinum sp. PSN259]|nr:hypothetical protein QBC43DRAFT_316663 [Cladorrhinum sp. PSN259]
MQTKASFSEHIYIYTSSITGRGRGNNPSFFIIFFSFFHSILFSCNIQLNFSVLYIIFSSYSSSSCPFSFFLLLPKLTTL